MVSFDANQAAQAIFRSIPSVLYGFPVTFVQVLRQPVQGPLTAIRRSRQERSLYLGPHVFIFFSSIIISFYFHIQYLVWGLVLDIEPLSLSDFIRPRISLAEFAVLYVSILVVYDAYGRALRALSRRSRGGEFYQASFYVFGTQALVLIIGSLVLTPIWFHIIGSREINSFIDEAIINIPVYIIWIYSLFLPVPWFYIILSKIIKTRWRLIAASFGISFLILSTASLALHAAIFLVGYARPVAAYLIDTTGCRHFVRDDLVEVIVAVKNDSDEPVFLDSKDVNVSLTLKSDLSEHIELSASEWVVPRSFIQRDEAGWILLELTLDNQVIEDMECFIEVHNPKIRNGFLVQDVVKG
jgi:hypothetical protein